MTPISPEEPAPNDRSDLPRAASTADVEPMSMSMLGRLFGIPLIIITTIVGGAIVVVFCFGAPATEQQRNIDSLLVTLEAGAGERSMGLLLPREKELWQTALELAMRLDKKESQLSEEELKQAASRLGSLVMADLGDSDRLDVGGQTGEARQSLKDRRLEFMIRALGRTQREEAIQVLVKVVHARREPFVAAAIHELANLHDLPAAHDAVDPILTLLTKPARAETRLLAVTALSVLANRGDQRVLDALAEVRLASEGEVAWAAALSLARLGSLAGKSTLLDLLDRSFWEAPDRYHLTDASGQVRRYAMPLARVDEALIAAMDAAADLDDVDVRGMIETLQSDKSPAVCGKATLVLASGS